MKANPLVRQTLAIVALPGVVAGLAPWLLLPADPWRRPGSSVAGGALTSVGMLVLVSCIRSFWRAGHGTLAPWDPPRHLVVVGLYRFVRNPMYLGVLSCVAGWAVFAGSPLLAGYGLLLAAGFHLRVILHEEPWLARRFTADWDAYKAAVPRWVPRLRAWPRQGGSGPSALRGGP